MPSLDRHTQERMLAGAVAPDDAPPGYGLTAEILRAARAAAPSASPERERDTVAAMAEHLTAQVERRPGMATPRKTARRARLVVLASAMMVLGTTGLAFAGALPRPLQDTAANVLSKIGVTVPAGSASTAPQDASFPSVVPSPNTGATISGIARNTDATGVAKGAAVSAAASNGKSQAGQHGAAASGGTTPPAVGGTSTADTHSGGASSTGTTDANQASSGHSSAGSGNNPGAGGSAPTTPPIP